MFVFFFVLYIVYMEIFKKLLFNKYLSNEKIKLFIMFEFFFNFEDSFRGYLKKLGLFF